MIVFVAFFFAVLVLGRRRPPTPPFNHVPFWRSSKVDLVPKEVVAKWLKHLRRSFPAIAFKASTQENTSSIKQGKVRLRYNRCTAVAPLMAPCVSLFWRS